MRNDITRRYIDWLFEFIGYDDVYRFTNLLNHLFQRKFYVIVEMDQNRITDGVKLREMYYREKAEYPIAAGECSVLEVLISLALRCEVDFMQDDEGEPRTKLWFWSMVDNLGLGRMDNGHYDYSYVDDRIDIFLNREYDRYGHGSIFPVENPKEDMRDTDLWYQMCWYLNEHYSFDI